MDKGVEFLFNSDVEVKNDLHAMADRFAPIKPRALPVLTKDAFFLSILMDLALALTLKSYQHSPSRKWPIAHQSARE
jgi:hypothetical protein